MRSPIIAFSIMAATVSPTLVSAMPTSPNMNTAVTHPRITEVQQGANALPLRRQLPAGLPGPGSVPGGVPGLGLLADPPTPPQPGPPSNAKSATNLDTTDITPYTEDAGGSIPTDPVSDAAVPSDPVSNAETVSNASAIPSNAQDVPGVVPKEPAEPIAANMVPPKPDSAVAAAVPASSLAATKRSIEARSKAHRI
ncbi:hypothetical protein BKA93DRAFT_825986 [Sparassis latifolia]